MRSLSEITGLTKCEVSLEKVHIQIQKLDVRWNAMRKFGIESYYNAKRRSEKHLHSFYSHLDSIGPS